MMSFCGYTCRNLGIECIASGQLPLKRMGYLLITNFTSPKEPIRMMVVNSLLGDLKLAETARVHCALHGVSYLIAQETLPIFIQTIRGILVSSAPPVRRLAIGVIQKAHAEGMTFEKEEFAKTFVSIVCDRDPSVMAAILPFILELVTKEAKIFDNFNFASCLVYILKQIIDGKLSPSFNFYTIPAPWTQVFSNKSDSLSN